MSENEHSDDPRVSGGRPARIGPYRILDVLGEGGMADVYLAEQTEPVKRRVALKILKAGMDSKQVVARFESERQALAVLDHPCIATIFDGGIAENGRPYFAMEYVKGMPITGYCDDHRLGNDARIRLFVDVCAAVQHAHLKGLIHRDLKPSNILVTVVDGKPQPKIIDFGIAKATTATLTEATLYTRVGQIVGTPQYMSPEQAGVTGLDVDTRTDIYSLGVILYELLVGTAPLDLAGIGDQAMQLALREKDPPRPSTRLTQLDDTRDEIARARGTDVEELRRQLSGDLDWVVMKAIEKDRTRRYETVNALAMECKRFLKHEPVLARPPSPGYLFKRFIQRNRLAVAAGSIAMLAIVAGAAAATFGYFQATEAEQVAKQEAETARQTSDFLVDLFEVSDPSEARGNTITAREVLDRGLDSVETGLADQPAVQATLMLTLGRVYQSLGLYVQAKALKEKSYALRTQYLGEDHPDTLEALGSLVSLALATGDYQRMAELAEQSYRLSLSKYGEDHPETIGALSDLGTARSNLGDSELAVEYSRQALAAARRSSEVDEGALEGYVRRLAIFLDDLGESEEARQLYEESLQMSRRMFGDIHLRTAFAIDNLAIHYDMNGEFDKAEPLYRQVLPILRQVYGDEHPEIAQSMGTYADFLVTAYSEPGHEVNVDLEEATELAIGALEMNRKLHNAEHSIIGDNLCTLAKLASIEKRYTEAEEKFLEAIDIYLVTLPAHHPKVVGAKHELGELLIRMGRLDDAERYLLESANTIESFDPDNRDREEILAGLIEVYRLKERPDKVSEYEQRLSEFRAGRGSTVE